MEITCKSCGTINDYRTEKKANNLVAFCNTCDKFIKNIPYSKPAIYFGKYKNKPIEEYFTAEEVNYLHWIKNSTAWDKLNERTKEAIEHRLTGR